MPDAIYKNKTRVKERTPKNVRDAVRRGTAPFEDVAPDAVELDAEAPLEAETEPLDVADDDREVENLEEDAIVAVADELPAVDDDVVIVPTVTVDRTPVSLYALDPVSEDGIGIEDVAEATDEEKEPVILLRLITVISRWEVLLTMYIMIRA